ncbi:MAG: SBBP repeat-containing protein [bacterium]
MKNIILVIVFSLFTSQLIANDNITLNTNITSIPLTFTENKGQWDEKVLFCSKAEKAVMWFTSEGVYHQFIRRIPKDNVPESSFPHNPKLDKYYFDRDSIITMSINSKFVGANQNTTVQGFDLMEYKCNYFIGNEPDKWRTNVPNYQAIQYESVYDGIDIKYYSNGSHMEYDFIVSPEGDPSQIQIQYDKVESISINQSGELVIKTEWGDVIEKQPVVYQRVKGDKNAVECEFTLLDDNTFGFKITAYDKNNNLIIDPVFEFSTFLGGSSYDEAYGIALDSEGNILVTGYASPGFPLENPYQTTKSVADIFITKINPDDYTLIFSTYLGGNEDDGAVDLTIDIYDNIYVAGRSWSEDFPIINAFQENLGGHADAVVTKFNSSGDSIIYSTYLGGNHLDQTNAIEVDSLGNAYLTGYSESPDYPTFNPIFTDFGFASHVIIAKLNPEGNSLIYSSFIEGNDWDVGVDIAIDNLGCAYVTGQVMSSNFPLIKPIQEEYNGVDAFFFKINSEGDALICSSYFGGYEYEAGLGIAVDSEYNIYIAGGTCSDDIPLKNPLMTYNGKCEAFIAKINSGCDSLIFSTYYGSEESDSGERLILENGFVFITGSYNGKAFILKLNESGNTAIYHASFGGDDYTYGHDLTVDDNGYIYIAGTTQANDFHVVNPIQDSLSGQYDAFITKLLPYLCGDVDGNDQINVADLVYMVNYIYKNGSEPLTWIAGDVNSSADIDMMDLILLVDYLFKGGIAPYCDVN